MFLKYLLPLSLLIGCQPEPPTNSIRPVRAMQLEEKKQVDIHTFPGRTRAVGRVNLSFRVEGPLIERPVQVGDKVKQGDLLARIDPRDFEIKLENTQGELEKAEAELRFAISDYERSQNIYNQDPGAISLSMLDRKKEDVSRLEGEVRALQAKVFAADDQLSYTYLTSPYAGTVVSTYVENYEYIQAKQPIIRLLNSDQIEMVIDVPENLITQIPYIDNVSVQLDALGPTKFPAEIKEIGEEASKTTRTYPVTLVIEQPESRVVFSGMAGYAYLETSRLDPFSKDGFLLPTTALFSSEDNTENFVWILDPETNQIHKQEVAIGPLTKDGIVVTSGLEKGMWVVTSGVNQLHDGQSVKLLPVTLEEDGEVIEL